jgi:hypothetical protein
MDLSSSFFLLTYEKVNYENVPPKARDRFLFLLRKYFISVLLVPKVSWTILRYILYGYCQ